MSEKGRKSFTSQHKAKIALEAVRSIKTVNEIAQEFGVHPSQVGNGKKSSKRKHRAFLTPSVVPKKWMLPQIRTGSSPRSGGENGQRLAKKKVRDWPVADRRSWVDALDPLAISRQCILAGVARSTFYEQLKARRSR